MPTVLSFGGIGNGLPGNGEYVYFWIPSWTSSGVTVSITLSSGYLICYASDRYQTPSNLPGYADWVITINSEYTETFIDPSSLGRPIGSFLSFAFLGQQASNNFTIQVDSGRVLTTSMLLILLLLQLCCYWLMFSIIQHWEFLVCYREALVLEAESTITFDTHPMA